MRICEAPQRSQEWFECRIGRLTASRMVDVMASPKLNQDGKPRGGVLELKSKSGYRNEIMIERLTGKPSKHFVSEAMERGNEKEPFARTAWEMATGLEADLVGFIFHPARDFTGASPDSLVGNDGGLEIKCPTSENHFAWCEAGVVPDEHCDQMQWNMACADREWWDFFSFDDRFVDKKAQSFRVRLYRDDKRIAAIEHEVLKMHAAIEYRIAALGLESFLPPIEAFMTQKPSAKSWETPEQFIDALADEVSGMNEMVP